MDVSVQMISTEVSESDITVTPALTYGKVVVNIPAGQASGSFTVANPDGKSPEGNVKFRILSLSLSEGYKIGTLQEMNLSFSPIVSTGGKLTLEGNDGAEKYANMVYVDLSNNSQIQIKRKSWTRFIRRTASLCWYSASGHRCMDRYTRCQSSRYGF